MSDLTLFFTYLHFYSTSNHNNMIPSFHFKEISNHIFTALCVKAVYTSDSTLANVLLLELLFRDDNEFCLLIRCTRVLAGEAKVTCLSDLSERHVMLGRKWGKQRCIRNIEIKLQWTKMISCMPCISQ